MEVYLVLIPITLALVALALWAFVWSVRHEQFEDLDKEAYSILFDEENEEQGKEKQKDTAGKTEGSD